MILLIANHLLQFFLLPCAIAILFCCATQIIFRKNAQRAPTLASRILRACLCASAATLIALGIFNGASTMLAYAAILCAVCLSEFYFLRLWKI